jgi:hypothetical protein
MLADYCSIGGDRIGCNRSNAPNWGLGGKSGRRRGRWTWGCIVETACYGDHTGCGFKPSITFHAGVASGAVPGGRGKGAHESPKGSLPALRRTSFASDHFPASLLV